MSHVVSLDKDGRIVYKGLLTSKEIATIEEILNALKTEIPQIEADLTEKYGKTVLYRYYLGKFLGELLEKYNIPFSERRKFWDEIKNFATHEKRSRKEGTDAVTRSFYEQCYILSKQDLDVVQKLSTRQWQDLLDRVGNREDERIFIWIKNRVKKIREDDWREFEKGLHLYLKSKDTSVFSDDELFEIYEAILDMSIYWRIAFKQFSQDNPKSNKINSKARRSKKYQQTCFKLKKERRIPFSEEIFAEAFSAAMK